MKSSENISYSAVVLDEESAIRLKQEYSAPDGWRWIGHHMTICMGPLPFNRKNLIGQEYSIVTTKIGVSETAFAVQVDDGGLSLNRIPHVTLAVSPTGKPVESNYIEEWKSIANRIRLNGIITEIAK